MRFNLSLQLRVFAILIISTACSESYKGKYFTEENGVISIEAESAEANPWWEHRSYYTGLGIRSVSEVLPPETPPATSSDTATNTDATVESEGVGTTFDGPAGETGSVTIDASASPYQIGYSVEFLSPGEVTVWLLTRRNYNESTSNTVNVVLAEHTARQNTPQPNILSHTKVELGDLNALQWVSKSAEGVTSRLYVPEAGLYTLLLDSEGEAGIHIDKIALVRDGAEEPQGVFIPETCRNCERVIAPKPVLPPSWVFGVYYGGYTNQQESRDRIKRLVDEDFPIDAYWIDSWFWDYEDAGRGPQGYMDFIGDTKHYPNPGKLWQWMDSLTIKSGIWVWNTILQDSNEVVFQDFKDRGFFSSVYLNRDRWHNQFGNSMTGDIDFSNPEAVAYYQSLLEPFFRDGLDFLKMDRSSSIEFTRANFEATQKYARHANARGYVMAHLHSTYDYNHLLYPTKWTGDAMSAWKQDGYPDMSRYAMGALRENIWMMANPRLSTYGIPFLTQDTGGYDFFNSTEFSPELYIRWSQFAAYTPVMLYFSHSRNRTSNMPYNFDAQTRDIIRNLLHERMMLFPYRYTYAIRTHETGQKEIIRGFADYPTQYLYGENLLVAPIYEKGAESRSVWLPGGTWKDWNTLLSANGGTIGQRVFEGESTIIADAPLSRIPVFVHAGSIVPLREYARSVELGNNDILHIHVIAGADGVFELLEDDGNTTAYERGAIARTKFSQVSLPNGDLEFRIAPVQGSYEGMKPDRKVRLVFHTERPVVSAQLDGQKIEISNQVIEFEYRKNRETKVIAGFD